MYKAKKDSEDDGMQKIIKYTSSVTWDGSSREDRINLLGAKVVVVKGGGNYFTGNTGEEAQAYFDGGLHKGESVMETMMRVGLDPRSVHQVVGARFFLKIFTVNPRFTVA